MKYPFYFFLLLTVSHLAAQNTDIPLNSWAYPVLDEWDVKSDSGIFTTVKPISRQYFANQSRHAKWVKTQADKFDKEFIQLETREYQDSVKANKKLFLGKFFKYASDVASFQNKNFDLHVNPIVVENVGHGTQSKDLLFENYRGLEMRGTIDKKVSFYTLLTENQARYPYYVQQMTDSTLAIPYEGFWKQYQGTGVDFFRARAYVDFNATKHIGVQFGYGKHFIGDGRRSLILSDIGNNYPYLRINTKIWKFQYTNIFAQLVAQTNGGSYGLLGTGAFPTKFLALHHLSMQVKRNLTIGLFESVISGDSTNRARIGYFNPVIFYKAFEQFDGSAGNTIIGVDFKWNLWKHVSFYGQLIIDEFVIKEVLSKNGWWGNKQGFQLGAKYFDVFGIKNLNGQVELNHVRPYVYSHESPYTSYSHYNMALAHPLGANFQELLTSLNYRPIARLKLQADLLLATYGNDIGNLSYGRDILKSYAPANRPGDYGNNMYNGVKTNLTMLQTRATYMVMHNMLIELGATLRHESSSVKDWNTKIFNVAVRWNFPQRDYLF